LLDGSPEAEKKLKTMLYFDVNNGVARRAWARNEGALTAIQQELSETMQITIPFLADDTLLDELI
jgi:urocanate hydratase